MKFSSLRLEPVGLRPPDAAQFLGVSPDLLERLRSTGMIAPAVSTHGLCLYDVSDLRSLWARIKAEGLPEPKRKKHDQCPA